MKKLFFSLLAVILFGSCSNEAEDVVPTGQTHKVTFNVTNFSSDADPLKSAGTNSNYCYYTIYEKESGKAIKHKTIFEPVAQITEDVSAGNYYISIFSVPTTINSPRPIVPDEDIDLSKYNFHSDYFSGIGWMYSGDRNNLFTYYEKVSFTVGAVNNEKVEMDVVLQPMWSVIDVEVTDAETCSLPEGTNVVICTVNPFYYGFDIASSIPSNTKEDSWTQFYANPVSDVSFRSNKGVLNKVVSASKDITVKLVFIKWSESDAGTLLGERVIYKGDVEGGKHITLKGTLGKSNNTNVAFSPTLGNLSDGGVIPFN